MPIPRLPVSVIVTFDADVSFCVVERYKRLSLEYRRVKRDHLTVLLSAKLTAAPPSPDPSFPLIVRVATSPLVFLVILSGPTNVADPSYLRANLPSDNQTACVSEPLIFTSDGALPLSRVISFLSVREPAAVILEVKTSPCIP